MARLTLDFEIAPEEYWITVPLDDIRLYLFSLNIDGKIGWRVPFRTELKLVDTFAWSCESCALSTKSEVPYLLIPVRDKR